MIFATVGSVLPFDRMIQLVDAWSGAHPEHEVFAQIGAGGYIPQNCGWQRKLQPAEFDAKAAASRLIVAHGGIGSVITASRLGKPILVVPRLTSMREHTTDHQLHTAKWLEGKNGVYVAWDEACFEEQIARALDAKAPPIGLVNTQAPKHFIKKLRHRISE